MSNIAELVGFCKAQAGYHARKATENGIKPSWATKHKNSESKFLEVVKALEETANGQEVENPIAEPTTRDLFTLNPFDLDDLPPELIDELKISKADTADSQIVELLKIAGRPLSISEILAGLFRKFQATHKRTALSARLYRMTQARVLEQAEGERGMYYLSKRVALQPKEKS